MIGAVRNCASHCSMGGFPFAVLSFPQAHWRTELTAIPSVMRGLDPRIHLLGKKVLRRWMDCRVISAFTRVFDALCPAMTSLNQHLCLQKRRSVIGLARPPA